jgi:hypothetical protein
MYKKRGTRLQNVFTFIRVSVHTVILIGNSLQVTVFGAK